MDTNVTEMSDSEIIACSAEHPCNPCFDIAGQCYIVTKLELGLEEPNFSGLKCSVEWGADVNVLATAREAYEYVADMERDMYVDADSCNKHAYTVRSHWLSDGSGDGVYYTATVRPMTAYKVDGDVRTDYDNVDAEDIARDGDFVSEFGTIGELFSQLGRWHAENPAHMDGHAAVGHEVVVTRWYGPGDEEGTVVAIYRTITPKLIHEVEAMD